MRWTWSLILPVLFATVPLQAQFWGLPGWAEDAVKASKTAVAPVGVDAWVLLDRTVISYLGEGEIRKVRTRVVSVLTPRGEGEGTFVSRGLGQKVSKIRKLKGWNLRPDGTVTKLDRDDLVSIDADALEDRVISAATLALATLSGVQAGSVVAFESQETLRIPLGPIDLVWPLEKYPIAKYSLEMDTDLRFFSSTNPRLVTLKVDPRNLSTWSRIIRQTTGSIELADLPGRPVDEPWASPGLETLPFISVVFADPLLTTCPSLDAWDSYGKWMHLRYTDLAEKVQPVPLEGKGAKEALLDLTGWMRESLSYRQVYLSSERGWIPERSPETIRRRYGDCKDLATCLMGGARSASLEAWPALARLDRAPLPTDAPVNPFIFNHAITAIRLGATLGYPAEVVTPEGRFLLVDPTSRSTPLGWLPPAHRRGRLLLCGPERSVWVEVPDAAIQEEKVEYRLEGHISPGGAIKGTLRIVEFGDALGLRSTALLEGAKGVRQQTLWLAPQALPKTWEVSSNQRPTDLATPFEVTVAFECADALLLKGTEWNLRLPSFPQPPQPLAKPKGVRRYPIEFPRGIETHWRAELGFDASLSLPGATARLQTPLREAAWTAAFKDGQLHLTLDHLRKPAHWPASDLEVALKVIKRDRSDFLLFLENALNFPANPETTPGHN